MIIFSMLSWSQLFLLFIISIILLGIYFDFEYYKKQNGNLIFKFLTLTINLIGIIFVAIKKGWIKFTTSTYIGLKIYIFLIYLENNYQTIKMKLKKKLIEQFIKISMSTSPTIIGTPRISNDTEDTEDE